MVESVVAVGSVLAVVAVFIVFAIFIWRLQINILRESYSSDKGERPMVSVSPVKIPFNVSVKNKLNGDDGKKQRYFLCFCLFLYRNRYLTCLYPYKYQGRVATEPGKPGKPGKRVIF